MSKAITRSAKSHKGKLHLKSLQPQFHEGIRQCVFLKGTKTSQSCQNIAQILFLLKKKQGVLFSKKKLFKPFEDKEKLKTVCFKNRSPFFCMK
jgi:hypothetical protein